MERSTGNGYITFDYDSDPFTPLLVCHEFVQQHSFNTLRTVDGDLRF